MVDTARKYTYVRETHGANRSPIIDVWNNIAGVARGSSWCMSFVYNMYKKAGGTKLTRTGSVWRQVDHADSYGSGLMCYDADDYGFSAKRGDIGCMSNKGTNDNLIGQSWFGHTYIVIRDAINGWVATIEGNTNNNGSREGNGVYERSRHVSKTLCFIRTNEH